MKYYCIADEDTVRGFQLAGVAGEAATLPAQSAAALHKAASQPDIGIVILTEPVANGIRGQIESLRQGQDRPLIVEIPGPLGSHPGQPSLTHCIRQAVGINFDAQEEPL